MNAQGDMQIGEAVGKHQRSDSAEDTKILQKGAECPPETCRNKWYQQAQIHRDAAQLERKIPPIVLAVKEHKIQKELLVQFSGSKKQTAPKDDAAV